MRSNVSKFMLFFILLILFQPTTANAYKLPVDDTMVCTNLAQRIEKEFEIKEHLLTTISSVESGKWSETRQQKLGWPWTINAAGKGMYFETKEDAVKKVKELQAQGVKSIDVGCMQINLVHHKDAFKNLEDAFDPETNIRYGAKFLAKLYGDKKDWIDATMAYHSSIEKKALIYKNKIVTAYEQVKKSYDALDTKLFVEQKASDKIKQAKVAKTVKKTVVTKKKVIKDVNVAKKDNKAKIDANEWREAKLEEYRANKARQ